MKIININNECSIFDIPLCPICDQPIEYPQLAAIGGVEEDGHQSFCLVHEDCALDED